MNIHEFQAKELFKKYNVPVLKGIVADSVESAYKASQELTGVTVVKSQIHAGGRGKGTVYEKNDRTKVALAGGVKVAKTAEEAKDYAQKILGNILVTHQTGPEGKEVKRLLIEQGCDIKKEYYLGLILDRATSRVTFMASTEGGMDIEEVAEHSPEKILRLAVDPVTGFQSYQGRKLGFGLGLTKEQVGKFAQFCSALYDLYIKTDCSIVEINPLVLTGSGDFIALDGKVNFDDNALYRHPEIVALRDLDEEDASEIEASQYELSYVSLDGNIGCMVNGAGLAMATLDIIKHFGGSPANFLDVGGGATREKVTAAFKIILKDPKVKAIFVNIFGGIMKCDIIAEGVVAAANEVGLHLPLIVRLQGTNVDLGKKILAESGLKIISADSMSDAAKCAVEASK